MSYRMGGNIDNVIDGLKNITYAKKKYRSSVIIEIQFLVNRYNEHQIPEVRKLAENMHVLLRMKSMQILNKEDISKWLPSDHRFRRYKIKAGEYEINSSLPDRCGRLWFNPVITWDGKIVPCCFDKDAEYIMGDLKEDSFREIWNGPRYKIFRRSILSGRHMIEICRNCTSGLKGAKY